MLYRQENLCGVASVLIDVGKAGYGYYQATEDERKAATDLALANAMNTATAREAARQAGYDSVQSEIDAEKQKRYLIYGAAVGIPVLIGLFLLKKGK